MKIQFLTVFLLGLTTTSAFAGTVYLDGYNYTIRSAPHTLQPNTRPDCDENEPEQEQCVVTTLVEVALQETNSRQNRMFYLNVTGVGPTPATARRDLRAMTNELTQNLESMRHDSIAIRTASGGRYCLKIISLNIPDDREGRTWAWSDETETDSYAVSCRK